MPTNQKHNRPLSVIMRLRVSLRSASIRVRRWLEFLSAYTYTLEYRKGSVNSNADFVYRLSPPAADADCTGSNCLSSSDAVGICLIRPCGFTPC